MKIKRPEYGEIYMREYFNNPCILLKTVPEMRPKCGRRLMKRRKMHRDFAMLHEFAAVARIERDLLLLLTALELALLVVAYSNLERRDSTRVG